MQNLGVEYTEIEKILSNSVKVMNEVKTRKLNINRYLLGGDYVLDDESQNVY